jgi:hypothetical protein
LKLPGQVHVRRPGINWSQSLLVGPPRFVRADSSRPFAAQALLRHARWL